MSIAPKRAFVVGHPIAHSHSPLIHRYWLDRHGIAGSYERIDVAPEAFADFLKELADNGYAGGNVTINTSTFVHSVTGGTYRLQISLIDPNGDAVTVLTQDFIVAAGADDTRIANPTYPLANASGIYTVQAQLFWLDPNQGNFPVQQDIAIAQFTHTVGVGASDFNNDSDGDGLLDDAELTLGTQPNDADTDDDGTSDGAEVGLNVATPVDSDGDGVINALESALLDGDNDGVPCERQWCN